MAFSHEFQRYRSVRPGQMLQSLVISILLHSTLLIASKYWLTAFTPEPKEEIPIEVVEVDPNETHIPQKSSFRATKDSIAGGKALPKRPVSAVKSANSDAHKASSKSPFDLTALSPAKVFQPESRQQKAESANLSPQQPKSQPTAIAPETIPVPKPEPTAIAPETIPVPKPEPTAIAPAPIPAEPKPQPTAIAPETIPEPKPQPTAIAPAPIPQPTAIAPETIPPEPKPKKIAIVPNITPPLALPRKTAMSTTGFAYAPAIRLPAPKPEPTAIAPAPIPLVAKPKKIAVVPNITPPLALPRKTAIAPAPILLVAKPKKIAVVPNVTPPLARPRKTAIVPVITSPEPKPKKIAVVPNITPPLARPRKTAIAPAITSPEPKPKKIAVVPNITPPLARSRKIAIAPAITSPEPKPKNLGQSGTRLSRRTPSQAQSSLKKGAASLLGGTQSVSSLNFSGDYLAALPNSNRDRQGHSGIDASSQNIDITSYLKQLQQKVKQQWLPEVSQSSRRTVLYFTIKRSGQLSNLQLAQTSGFSVTDQAALKAIQRAAPFASLPTGYRSNHIDIQFTFNINVYGQLNLSGDGG